MKTSKTLQTRQDLAKTKILREFGIKDLERYIKKIKENIKVFEFAIEREKTEMKRARNMMEALKKDINTIDSIQKWQK